MVLYGPRTPIHGEITPKNLVKSWTEWKSWSILGPYAMCYQERGQALQYLAALSDGLF